MVSIIVPVYNSEDSLNRCLNSLIRQTYSDCEFLIIDDGSKDKSAQICDEYAKVDSRIKVFHTANHGVSNARNYGIQIAEGDFISFLDSDDELCFNFIECMLNALTTSNKKIAVCSYYSIDNDVVEIVPKGTISEETIISFDDYSWSGPLRHFTCWGALYKSELFQTGILFDSKYSKAEDSLFFSKMLVEADGFVFVPDALYKYYIYNNSLSHGFHKEESYDEIFAWKDIVNLYSKFSFWKLVDVKTAFARRCKLSLIYNYLYDSNNTKMQRFILDELRHNVCFSLLSTISIKSKLLLLLCSAMPRFYLIAYKIYLNVFR